MKKQLNEENIKNELQGSAFFRKDVSPIPNAQVEKFTKKKDNQPSHNTSNDVIPPNNHDTMQPSNHATVIPSIQEVDLEPIRKALKSFGKEAATHRFTPSEKREIAELIYLYRRQGIKTNENEITRIAINFLLNDQKENLDNSILDQVLHLLNE